MKKTKHVYANSNEWVRVHRSGDNRPPSQPAAQTEWWIKPVGWLVGIVAGLWLLEALLPYLLAGVIGYEILKSQGKKHR